MMKFTPGVSGQSSFTVLCLGAHCDDIEIGCGGTLLRLLPEYPQLSCMWVVASADARREAELQRSARRFLEGAGRVDVVAWQFRDGYLPYEGAAVKDAFERLKLEIAPDLVFTHFRDDLHQDHRLINSLTWNTFRDHAILEYEIPKYDGDFRSPNLYVPLDVDQCCRKVAYLMECYESQRTHRWFTEETFRAVLRLRGVESGAASGYAEGFYARKVLW